MVIGGVAIDTGRLFGIRFHGRGGQGSVTSAELLAQAAISEGKYAQAFPAFGPERRGAPVQAFVRVDASKPIRVRAEVTDPDVVVILDPGLLSIVNVTSGLKEDGMLVVNARAADDIAPEIRKRWPVAVIDATRIARELLGVPIVNTTMLGALVKATGIVKLESLFGPLQKRFGRIAEKNTNAMKKAFAETLVKEKG